MKCVLLFLALAPLLRACKPMRAIFKEVSGSGHIHHMQLQSRLDMAKVGAVSAKNVFMEERRDKRSDGRINDDVNTFSLAEQLKIIYEWEEFSKKLNKATKKESSK